MITKEEMIKWLFDQEKQGKLPATWDQVKDYGDGDSTIIRFHTCYPKEKDKWMKLKAMSDLLRGWCEGQPTKLQYSSAEDILHKPLDIYDQEEELNGEQKAVLVNFIKIWEDIENSTPET